MQYLNDQGHLTDEALSLYAEALKLEQLGQLPEALREHLEHCSSCQEQAMALYALIADEDYSELGPHPSFGREGSPTTASTLKMWFRPLLLLLMAVLALFLYWQQQQQAKEQPPAVNERPPATMPTVEEDSLGAKPSLSLPQAKVESEGGKPGIVSAQDTKAGASPKPQIPNQKSQIKNPKSKTAPSALAANYRPSETLEPLVGTVTRSQGLSDIEPANGQELKIDEAVVFSWQTSSEEPLTLRLLNNQEAEVFNRSVEGSRLASPVKLTPGLYYWKLETKEDLLYVGKFLVGSDRIDR